MSYADEKMIKAMNTYKEGVQGNIEEGILIKEERYIFEEIGLFDSKMYIMLPKSFSRYANGAGKVKIPDGAAATSNKDK